jgi:hypothetical protein
MAVRLLLAVALLVAAGAGALAQTQPTPPPAPAEKPKKVYPLPPPAPPIMAPPGSHPAPGALDTVTDKATRCLHYANSIGVPADQMDDYMKRCTRQ